MLEIYIEFYGNTEEGYSIMTECQRKLPEGVPGAEQVKRGSGIQEGEGILGRKQLVQS